MSGSGSTGPTCSCADRPTLEHRLICWLLLFVGVSMLMLFGSFTFGLLIFSVFATAGWFHARDYGLIVANPVPRADRGATGPAGLKVPRGQ